MELNHRKNGRATLPVVSILMLIGIGLGIPATAIADSSTANLEFIIVSDDLRKTTTETERPEGATPAAPAPNDAGDGGQASNDQGSDGKSNNGHGNNVDGVDSSNPGQGKGGPNAAGADSDPTVDDEAKGGGASPSKKK